MAPKKTGGSSSPREDDAPNWAKSTTKSASADSDELEKAFVLAPRALISSVAVHGQGFNMPPSPFLLAVVAFYQIRLNNLNPSSITMLAVFAALCEMWLGVPPSLLLWRYFYRLKRYSGNAVAGACGFQLREQMAESYIPIRTCSSNNGWNDKWFYCQTGDGSVLDCSMVPPPLSTPEWTAHPQLPESHLPCLQRITELRDVGLTANLVAYHWLRRQISPLKARVHFDWDYTGGGDSTANHRVDRVHTAALYWSNSLFKDVPSTMRGPEPYSKTHPREASVVQLAETMSVTENLLPPSQNGGQQVAAVVPAGAGAENPMMEMGERTPPPPVLVPPPAPSSDRSAATGDVPWPLKRLRLIKSRLTGSPGSSQAAMPVGASRPVAPSSSPTVAVPPVAPSDAAIVAELDKWKEDLNAARGVAEMVCSFCLDQNCMNESLERFTMVMFTLSGDFSQKVTVPCKARLYFNSLVRGEFVMFAWRGIPYAVSVRKKRESTQLSGEWNLFVSDHKLEAGDRVMLEYLSQSRGWRCLPFDKDEVERFPAVSLGVIEERRIAGCIFSNGIGELLASERRTLLKRLDETEIPYFKPFVHRLTITNVEHELRLPKWIAEVLSLGRSGTIIFKDVNREVFAVDYTVSTDGRAICPWGVVVGNKDLRVGNVVMLVPAVEDDKSLVVIHKLSFVVS